MELYYWHDPVGNYGDDLNPWLWPRLFPKPIEECFDEATVFVGIGSLLNHKIPPAPTKKIVFGSGFGYGDKPKIDSSWQFSCVRGPLTARLLELPENTAICDSALLLREFFDPADEVEHKVSFMPHHLTAKYDDWASVCKAIDVHYIDPADPVEQTTDAIRRSSLVVTESLHGAIVADAFRVPWISVRTRRRIVEYKWQDWASSLNLEHEFGLLPPAWKKDIDRKYKRLIRPVSTLVAQARLKWIIKYGKPNLSEDHIFEQVYQRLRDAFAQLVEIA